MAKGAESKKTIAKKIMEMFDGAFEYNDGKEIRIPYQEDGQEIQIKVALTCAKDNVTPGDDIALPGEKEIVATGETFQAVVTEEKEIKPKVEPTAEEKQNVSDLLRSLRIISNAL